MQFKKILKICLVIFCLLRSFCAFGLPEFDGANFFMAFRKKLEGKRFGRLLVLEYVYSKNSRPYYKCVCNCGIEKIVLGSYLMSGNSNSCGCYRREHSAKTHTKHGYSRTKEYHAWCDMRRRCLDKKNTHYHTYGGRGITICERWLNSFELFLADMGKCPYNLTLDRKDVNGNYEPSNCRWASDRQQYFNKTTTRYLTNRGFSLPVTKWASIMGIKPRVLFCRIYGNFKLGLDEIPLEKIQYYVASEII